MEPIRILTDSPFNRIDYIRRILFYDDFVTIDAVVNNAQKIFVKKITPTRTMILTDQDEIGKDLLHQRTIPNPYGIAIEGKTISGNRRCYFVTNREVYEIEARISVYIHTSDICPKLLKNNCAYLTPFTIYTPTHTFDPRDYIDGYYEHSVENHDIFWVNSHHDGEPIYAYTNEGLTPLELDHNEIRDGYSPTNGIIRIKRKYTTRKSCILFDTYTATKYDTAEIDEEYGTEYCTKICLKYKDFVIIGHKSSPSELDAISIHSPSLETVIKTRKLIPYGYVLSLTSEEKLYILNPQTSEVIQIEIGTENPEIKTSKLPERTTDFVHIAISGLGQVHIHNGTFYAVDEQGIIYYMTNII